MSNSFVAGLYFEIPCDGMRSHLQTRIAYHEGRAKEKEDNILPKLKEASEIFSKNQTALTMGNVALANYSTTSGFRPDDAVSRIEAEISEHRSKAKKFKTLMSYLVDAPYRLSQSDMRELEII